MARTKPLCTQTKDKQDLMMETLPFSGSSVALLPESGLPNPHTERNTVECLPTQRIHQSVRLKITGFLLPLLWHFGREESIFTMSNYLSWKNSVVKNRTWTLFIGIPAYYHSEVVPGTYDALCFICLIFIFFHSM